MSEYRLIQAVISLSQAINWDAAKLEWKLETVYEADEAERCICGHFPIVEVCIIRNQMNSNLATVGNCCVKKFIGLPSDKIFQAIKRVRKDDEKSLNSEAIAYAHEKVWINDWERDFYLDLMSKRNLSPKQLAKKKQINQKLAIKMKKQN